MKIINNHIDQEDHSLSLSTPEGDDPVEEHKVATAESRRPDSESASIHNSHYIESDEDERVGLPLRVQSPVFTLTSPQNQHNQGVAGQSYQLAGEGKQL